jgi:hypothetical protein
MELEKIKSCLDIWGGIKKRHSFKKYGGLRGNVFFLNVLSVFFCTSSSVNVRSVNS